MLIPLNAILYRTIVCVIFLGPSYLVGIFTHLKLCLADAIHNPKWVKIIQVFLDNVSTRYNVYYPHQEGSVFGRVGLSFCLPVRRISFK